MTEYRRRSNECWNLWLAPYDARGAWGGGNPFLPLAPRAGSGPVAVLTRAAIRLQPSAQLLECRAVHHAQASIGARGLLASVGPGETPFVRPATFSLWRSEADLVAYAYGDAQHEEVIRRRAAEGWYSEELFARFTPLRSEGTWKGTRSAGGLLRDRILACDQPRADHAHPRHRGVERRRLAGGVSGAVAPGAGVDLGAHPGAERGGDTSPPASMPLSRAGVSVGEVLVYDDRSDDGTAELVRAHARRRMRAFG